VPGFESYCTVSETAARINNLAVRRKEERVGQQDEK
jgi:hypothetical protein